MNTESLQLRIKELETQLDNIYNMSVYQRVVCYMQRLCAAHELNHAEYKLPVSKTVIAYRIGIHLETFSRAITKVSSMGIDIRGRTVKIEPSKARKAACDHCFGTEHCKAFRIIHGNPYGKDTDLTKIKSNLITLPE